MTATAKCLIRLIDLGKISLEQIAETTKWAPFKQEVEAELEARKEVN